MWPLMRFICLCFIVSASLIGCSSFPVRDIHGALDLQGDYEQSSEYEAHFTERQPLEGQGGWWHLYEDAELNNLMDYAFSNNPSIAQARARLQQAQALTDQSRSALLPNASISAERSTQNGDNAAPSDISLVGAASYELDVWGKNRASAKSDDLEYQATRYDLQTAHITLSASIVENWLHLLSLIHQEKLIKKQIEINKTVLSLQQKRFEMGSASALDILQQKEILAQSESNLPDVISEQKQTANAISYLIGNVPRHALRVTEKPMPAPIPVPEVGLASSLLAQRPDVTAAWLRLRSADWAAEAAWANRLPSFTLSANASTVAKAVSGLFDTWLLDMAAGVGAPLFDAGQRKAQELQRRALADERYHAYREVVLGAVVDVEDAMIRNVYQDQKLNSIEKQLKAAHETLEQAQITYANGQSSYINVLNSLKNTQSLEQQLVREQLAQAIERVGLYRALGGNTRSRNIAYQSNSEGQKQ